MFRGKKRKRAEVIIFFCLFWFTPLIGLTSFLGHPFPDSKEIKLLIGWINRKCWTCKKLECDYSSIDTLRNFDRWNGIQKSSKAFVKSRSHSLSHKQELYRSETSIKNRQLIFLNLFSSDLSLDFFLSRNDFFTHFSAHELFFVFILKQKGRRRESGDNLKKNW